jgi:hypothetical protein
VKQLSLSTLAATVTLLFTLPDTGQRVVADPSQGQDSVGVECSGGQAIHQLMSARLYYSPITGGGWRVVGEKSAVGREGQPDSFVVDPGPGGHYYVTATNPRGESCPSSTVFVPGQVVTGVEPEPPSPRPIRTRIFDVRGRPLTRPTASGIYFRRTYFSDGSVHTKKFVYLK